MEPWLRAQLDRYANHLMGACYCRADGTVLGSVLRYLDPGSGEPHYCDFPLQPAGLARDAFTEAGAAYLFENGWNVGATRMKFIRLDEEDQLMLMAGPAPQDRPWAPAAALFKHTAGGGLACAAYGPQQPKAASAMDANAIFDELEANGY